MENFLGLLRLRVRRGINLAIRDTRSSDPYVVVTMAGQACLLALFFLFYYKSSIWASASYVFFVYSSFMFCLMMS